jgi:ethylmalonyl-CoA/methylmalonyl-CoA decarboxylase
MSSFSDAVSLQLLMKFLNFVSSCVWFTGKALGGGAEVAVACDYRAFAKDASIGFVQSKLGLTPGWGGGVRLVELIGRKHALRALSNGVIYTGEEARLIGLADYLVNSGQDGLNDVQTALRQLTSAKSPAVQQAAKKVVVNASAVDFSAKLDGERDIFGTVWGGPAHVEAMSGSVKFTSGKQ